MTDPARLIDGVAREIVGLDVEQLRNAIRDEYTAVAAEPERGFHFHTGRRLAAILEYQDEWLEGIPEPTIASFAGTGNPFVAGSLNAGENVVDVGCGAGIDSMIAAKMVGPTGRVVGVDMTPAMVQKAQRSAGEAGFRNVEFRQGLAEALGLFGALLGIAILALRVAVVGLVAWGTFRLFARLFRGPTPRSQPTEIPRLAPADPHYEAALRELDRELGVR